MGCLAAWVDFQCELPCGVGCLAAWVALRRGLPCGEGCLSAVAAFWRLLPCGVGWLRDSITTIESSLGKRGRAISSEAK